MSPKFKEVNDNQRRLFAEITRSTPPPKIKWLKHPVWTENKSKLIERYIFLFLMVTKHGTYIDGFAGPQKSNRLDMWAAKLVADLKPQWLRHLYLFEKNRKKHRQLQSLKRRNEKLDIQIFKGDFNKLLLTELLSKNAIAPKEATFCLLDQHTFECHWSTVRALAEYKKTGSKIELFYFYPYFWLDRALAAQKKTEVLNRWWGGDGWRTWRRSKPEERKEFFLERFKKELGYEYAFAWPIYRRKHGGSIMYHMIHATDYPEAPALMSRAYNKTLDALRVSEQLAFSFSGLKMYSRVN